MERPERSALGGLSRSTPEEPGAVTSVERPPKRRFESVAVENGGSREIDAREERREREKMGEIGN